MSTVVSLLVDAAWLAPGTVWSAPMASYTHNHGSAQSTERFSDAFDFRGLACTMIDSFALVLTFARTDDNPLGIPPDRWFARPGGTPDQFDSVRLSAVGRTALGSDDFRLAGAKLDTPGTAPEPCRLARVGAGLAFMRRRQRACTHRLQNKPPRAGFICGHKVLHQQKTRR